MLKDVQWVMSLPHATKIDQELFLTSHVACRITKQLASFSDQVMSHRAICFLSRAWARFVPTKICFNMLQWNSIEMLKPWSSSCWSPYFLYLLILPQVESSPRCAAVLTVVLASSKTIARMTSIIIAPAKIRKSNHHCKLSQIITFVRVTKIFRQVTLVSSWGYGLPLPELKVQVHQAALIMAGRLLQFVFICIYYDH